MSYLQLYDNQFEREGFHRLEANFKLPYRVAINRCDGVGCYIFNGREKIARVQFNNVEIYEKDEKSTQTTINKLLKERSDFQLINGDNLKLPAFSDEIYINDTFVGEVNYGGGLWDWIVDMYQEKRIKPYNLFYQKITFDENKLHPFVALCILVSLMNKGNSG